jgi:hypothetical protein
LSTVKRKKKQKAPPPPVPAIVPWSESDERALPGLSEWERIVLLAGATSLEQASIKTARDVAQRYKAAAAAARDLSWDIKARGSGNTAALGEALSAIASDARERALARAHRDPHVAAVARKRSAMVDSVLASPLVTKAFADLQWISRDTAVEVERLGLMLDQVSQLLDAQANSTEEMARSQRRGTRGDFPEISSRWLLSIAAERRIGVRELSELVGEAMGTLFKRFGHVVPPHETEELFARMEAIFTQEKNRLQRR